jgi:hypothetical protein
MTWFPFDRREMQGLRNIALKLASQIEPEINAPHKKDLYLFYSAFEDDDRDFDSEEMFSFDDPVDFDTALQSLFSEFLDFDVDFIHAWISDIRLSLSDTTDETDHGCTTVIPPQSLVERALDKSCFKGVDLE